MLQMNWITSTKTGFFCRTGVELKEHSKILYIICTTYMYVTTLSIIANIISLLIHECPLKQQWEVCWRNSVRICPISRPSTSIWALRKHSSWLHILSPGNHQVNLLGEDLRKIIFFRRQATIGPTAVNSIMSFNYAGGTPYKVDP